MEKKKTSQILGNTVCLGSLSCRFSGVHLPPTRLCESSEGPDNVKCWPLLLLYSDWLRWPGSCGDFHLLCYRMLYSLISLGLRQELEGARATGKGGFISKSLTLSKNTLLSDSGMLTLTYPRAPYYSFLRTGCCLASYLKQFSPAGTIPADIQIDQDASVTLNSWLKLLLACVGKQAFSPSLIQTRTYIVSAAEIFHYNLLIKLTFIHSNLFQRHLVTGGSIKHPSKRVVS